MYSSKTLIQNTGSISNQHGLALEAAAQYRITVWGGGNVTFYTHTWALATNCPYVQQAFHSFSQSGRAPKTHTQTLKKIFNSSTFKLRNRLTARAKVGDVHRVVAAAVYRNAEAACSCADTHTRAYRYAAAVRRLRQWKLCPTHWASVRAAVLAEKLAPWQDANLFRYV